jgi:uncharacterized membrane protein YkoI
MRPTFKKTLAGVAAFAALGLGGAAYVQASGSGDDADDVVTGPAADAAKAAALKITEGGRVDAVERDSDNGAIWEVEVTKPDGSAVEVSLDKSNKLAGLDDDNEADDNEADDNDD